MELCKKCGSPVILKKGEVTDKKIRRGTYYFKEYYICENKSCKAIWNVDKTKVWITEEDKQRYEQGGRGRRVDSGSGSGGGGDSLSVDKYSYLRTEHWALLRKEIRNKRKVCEICGSNRKLNVHHRHYRSVGKETEEDVYLLCEEHHHQLHKIAKKRHISYDEAFEVLKKYFIKKSSGRPKITKEIRLQKKERHRIKQENKRLTREWREKRNTIEGKRQLRKEQVLQRKKMVELREKRLKLWNQ